jgi:RNA polymerase sigma factor (sigma-70 family)
MQGLWLQAHRKADTLRGSDPEPWLWRIARNLLREHQRKQRSSSVERAVADPALARVLAERFDTDELPDELLARNEVRDQLLLALTELASDDQELLIGFYFHGRSQTDLAGALSISVRAVEGRLYRARLALRNRLADLEI